MRVPTVLQWRNLEVESYEVLPYDTFDKTVRFSVVFSTIMGSTFHRNLGGTRYHLLPK
jgi:hypothetical protein